MDANKPANKSQASPVFAIARRWNGILSPTAKAEIFDQEGA